MLFNFKKTWNPWPTCADDVFLLELIQIVWIINNVHWMFNLLPNCKGEALIAVNWIGNANVSRSLELSIRNTLEMEFFCFYKARSFPFCT